MKGKIVFAAILILFAASVTAVEHSERTVDDRIEAEAVPGVEARGEIDKAMPRCSLEFHENQTYESRRGNLEASLSCPDGSMEHTDDWISARLVGGSDSGSDSRVPEEVAVVSDPVRCPDGVCYRMSSGTIDVNVLNNPPKTSLGRNSSPIYEGEAVGGENILNSLETTDTVSVIGFGSFSISKRSARTGPNPQTGKEIQSSGEESDQALANRMLSSVKASNCPEDGRERCVVESVKNSEVYSDLSGEGEVEILMTLTADPLVVPRKEVSRNCEDSDTDLRPGEVCGKTTHFIDPDSDGDGLPDLTMDQTGDRDRYDWKISGETVANAAVNSAKTADTEVIFLQVDSSGTEVASRAELVETMTSKAGLSKADSKKALDSFVEATLAVELDKSSPYLAKSTEKSADIDKASPKLYESLAKKDARIKEMGERIRELKSSQNQVNSTLEASSEQGDDSAVRKKPGRDSLDADSDGDGISDTVEESDEPVQRPGFVDRLLSSIFRR